MNNVDRAIIAEYRKSKSVFDSIEQIVVGKINRVIEENNISVMDVAHRVKDEMSLQGKIGKKSGKYKSLNDITDIVGFRVICFFSDGVDKIGTLMDELFDIDEDNSVDKRELISATQFGYLSLHKICSLKKSDEYPDDYCSWRFEIQIRTVLQHTWAEIEHDLGYKSEFGVPRHLRREFSRIAGLLEIADEQFVSLRDNLIMYEDDIRSKIISGDADDIAIDRISLSEYMKHNRDMVAFIDRLAKESNADVEYISPESYLEQLDFLGLKTIGDLSKLLKDNGEFAYQVAMEKILGVGLDIFSTNLVLRYLCRCELKKSNYSEEQIRRFVSLAQFDRERIETDVKRIMEY